MNIKKNKIKQIKKDLKQIEDEQFSNATKLFWGFKDYSISKQLADWAALLNYQLSKLQNNQ